MSTGRLTPCANVLLFNELHASIFSAAGIGAVVSDGFVRALTDGTHVEGIAAKLFERLDHSLSTLLRERVVDGVRALVVSMALHLETNARVLLHIVGHLLNLSHRLGFQRSFTRFE